MYDGVYMDLSIPVMMIRFLKYNIFMFVHADIIFQFQKPGQALIPVMRNLILLVRVH